MAETHAHYLQDLGALVRATAEQAKGDAAVAEGADGDFQRGRVMAYCEVISLMQQQASAFALPLRDIGLEGFDPERVLLGQ